MKKRAYSSEIRTLRQQKTKARIVAQALAIARVDGLDEVGFQRLSNEARIGLRTVFRHFPTRAKLVAAIRAECVVTVSEGEFHSLPAMMGSICRQSEKLGELAVFGRLSDESLGRVLELLAISPGHPAAPAAGILLSPPCWQILHQKYAMSSKQASDYLQSMIHRLLGDARQATPSAPLISQPDDFID